MPTCYTAKLMEHGESFEQFVWRCARNFGACILMRDDPVDKLPPERFEPSDYDLKQLVESRATLKCLEEMSESERMTFAENAKRKDVDSARKAAERAALENKRLDDMTVRVQEWKPPTADHVRMKEFMLEQLATSRNSDYAARWMQSAKSKPTMDYYTSAVDSALKGIDYHAKQNTEEINRTELRNQWLAALRESVPLPQQ